MLQVSLREPVIAADGHSYEKAALQDWLQHSNASPVTGILLPHNHVAANITLRQWIRESSLL